MATKCTHSCKGLCNALETAERREQEAITFYREYAAQCDYPDVRELLKDLISAREKGLAMVREKKEILTANFDVLDQINENFS